MRLLCLWVSVSLCSPSLPRGRGETRSHTKHYSVCTESLGEAFKIKSALIQLFTVHTPLTWTQWPADTDVQSSSVSGAPSPKHQAGRRAWGVTVTWSTRANSTTWSSSTTLFETVWILCQMSHEHLKDACKNRFKTLGLTGSLYTFQHSWIFMTLEGMGLYGCY